MTTTPRQAIEQAAKKAKDRITEALAEFHETTGIEVNVETFWVSGPCEVRLGRVQLMAAGVQPLG